MKTIIIVAILTIIYVLGMDLANKYIDKVPINGNNSNQVIIVEEKLTVSIRGAVNNPGTYTVDEYANLNVLIFVAGGLREDADMSSINTTLALQNGKDYYIPTVLFDENQVSIKISLNEASIEELQTLPGIGSVYSNRIVEYREENGYFQALEEIQNIKGIGQTTFENIKDLISL